MWWSGIRALHCRRGAAGSVPGVAAEAAGCGDLRANAREARDVGHHARRVARASFRCAVVERVKW